MRYLFFACVALAGFGSALFALPQDYKTASWNLQGSSASTESKWSISVRQLISGENAADVLAIQEAGSLPHTATPTGRQIPTVGTIPIQEFEWSLGSRSRPESAFVYYSPVDAGANRVNLAIVSRRRADDVIVLPPPTSVSRPIIGIRLGNDVFFSVHALANGGTDTVAIINAVFDRFRNEPDVRWMIMGDFNRSPENLRFELRLETRLHVEIIAPNAATHRSGGTLDYAVVGSSSQLRPQTGLLALLMLANFRTQLTSDHFPVNFRRFDP
ncbi:cytolethal distending toxin subunit CdtB [Helicobacter sp. CLO-3]|uniref:cytolethal distending toxin subunit B family protein n=1 Tax=unclassified Helicobacter TaxID=2593540 RepID=UPI00080522E8|nr:MULTISPECIES: cytolethal distending toxin subunit B family protein [unclassified Helicobacter]OBV29450.1 cytolethal distending toxin subunit CdtB [Helicobacter sp. CLO-3]OHU84653.1 cytolethal distending toxin subunit CdtB [Helicobacter sp. CLO-3]